MCMEIKAGSFKCFFIHISKLKGKMRGSNSSTFRIGYSVLRKKVETIMLESGKEMMGLCRLSPTAEGRTDTGTNLYFIIQTKRIN